MSSTLLSDIRVLDCSSGIAGPYCAKLFADAGADVIKVESPSGDPLRRWTASQTPLGTADGVLFSYLNAGKRSVGQELISGLVGDADLLIDDGSLGAQAIEQLRASYPKLSVVVITPFGLFGPWADRPTTEFILQAISGSLGGRGEPEREPLQVGGRIGEFIAGGYAAVAGLGVLMDRHAREQGDLVDVSILECMCITMGDAIAALGISLGRPRVSPTRFVEVPSIEMASDEYVGLCTITAQQFLDLAVMIGHPEIAVADETYAARQRRRRQFETLVRDWTCLHTAAEIVEATTAKRIPATRVGTPETLTSLDHFVERSVFVPGSSGTYVQPRRPYLVDGMTPATIEPAPSIGEHSSAARWRRPRDESTQGDSAVGLTNLRDIRIVDFTAFWAGPTTTQLLAAFGADVIKVESIQRPDGIRYSSAGSQSGPSWWEFGSFYQNTNFNKRDITLDLGSPHGRELAVELITKADVVIENFSPRVLDNFGITWEMIHERAPHIVMVRMPAFGLGGPWRDRTGFAQTVEQLTGLAWMTGYRDGPPLVPRGICDPNAGVHAAFAVLAALEARALSGTGQLVECPMVEAALNIAAEMELEYSAYGASLGRDGNRGPSAAPQGVYACRGHEQWLALSISTDEQWNALRQVLGDPDWAGEANLQSASGRRVRHDMLDEHLRIWLKDRDLDAAVGSLVAAGVPAAKVVEPADVLENPQLQHRGFVELLLDHPVVGQHSMMGLPFRFASRNAGWIERPAPTLGQHNDEVLIEILGLSPAECGELRAAGVIGEQPITN